MAKRRTAEQIQKLSAPRTHFSIVADISVIQPVIGSNAVSVFVLAVPEWYAGQFGRFASTEDFKTQVHTRRSGIA